MKTWSLIDGRWKAGELPGAEGHWYDVIGTDDLELDALAKRYGLHPLAIEDCRSPNLHAPKIDDFRAHLFVVLQAFVDRPGGPVPEELDVFLGKDFLITYRDRPIAALHDVAADMEAGIVIRPGVDGLFYAIADRVVDAVLPLVNSMGDVLDDLEDGIITGPVRKQTQREILEMRTRAGRMRRLVIAQAGVMQRFARAEFELICTENQPYFRDVYDHLYRVDLLLEGLREDSDVALGTYLSAVNNQLSEVMKVLSVVGALALPASVIAGIFGTNFDNIPGLHSNAGFFVMLAGMATVAISMAVFFRRRGWF